jgi:hypothetical protein
LCSVAVYVFAMKLSEDLVKKLSQKYEASSLVPLRYKNNDLVLKTDKEGNAIQLFIGKANAEGVIKGDRYSRSIIKDREGKITKDYWERKGRAS